MYFSGFLNEQLIFYEYFCERPSDYASTAVRRFRYIGTKEWTHFSNDDDDSSKVVGMHPLGPQQSTCCADIASVAC